MFESTSEDQIEISNRFSSYTVSKSLICLKCPYFSDLCKSKSVKKLDVELNESGLRAVISWLYSDCCMINMENVCPLFEVAWHLNIVSIQNNCHSFFNENFSAEHIPVLIQLDQPSYISNYLNSFLSKNFLRIFNGEYFLKFPVEVVKYILSLDLTISSEYQIFQAILKWIKHDESRIIHLPDLMKHIRWCFTFKNCYSRIAEDEYIVRKFPQLDELTCEPGECRNRCLNDRVKAQHLISIHSLDDNFISICYYNGDNCWEPCGSFEEDNQINAGIFTDEYSADIIFDSGRQGLRINFFTKKYRWLEMSGSSNAYHSQLYKWFKPKFDRESSYRAYIDDVKRIKHWIDIEKNTLIENEGVMNIICYPQKEESLYCFLPVEHSDWYNFPFAEHRIHAIVLHDVYYIITKSLTFRIFDSAKKTIEKSKPFEGMNFSFNDLQLDAHQSNVILLIKSQRKIMVYDTCSKIWSLMGQIYSDNKIIALTESYIPIQFADKLYLKKQIS